MLDTTTLTSAFLRDHVAEVLDHVHHRERRYLITRRGRAVAGLILPSDLARLEELDGKSLARKKAQTQAMLDSWERAKVFDPKDADGLF